MKIQATFVASPTADELLAAVSMLAPPQLQENDDLPSSGSAVTDALQAFISGEYLQDFGGSIPSPAAGDPAPPGTHSVSQPGGDSRPRLVTFECVASTSPISSFYTMTSSLVSTIEPSPPPYTKHQAYVPTPRGVPNAAVGVSVELA